MKLQILAALAAAVALAAGCTATNESRPGPLPAYHQVARYAVGGAGGWDFLSVDDRRQRLFVSRGDRVQVVDLRSGRLEGTLADTPGVHGIAIADDLGLGFTSNGRGDSVTAFRLDSLAAVTTIPVQGSNPDAILYDAYTHSVLAFNGHSSSVTAIDARTLRVKATLELPGKPEVGVSDGKGTVYVNLEDKSSVAAIDMSRFAITADWPLGGCEGPTGLAIDTAAGRLFSVCGNGKMAVVDVATGHVLQELPIGARADGVAFDAVLRRVVSSNGEGTLTVFHETRSGRLSGGDAIPTQWGARTIALDPSSHRLYLPTASFGEPEAAAANGAAKRRPIIDGTFVIVVMAPHTTAGEGM